jgi:hypothetical protein
MAAPPESLIGTNAAPFALSLAAFDEFGQADLVEAGRNAVLIRSRAPTEGWSRRFTSRRQA